MKICYQQIERISYIKKKIINFDTTRKDDLFVCKCGSVSVGFQERLTKICIKYPHRR